MRLKLKEKIVYIEESVIILLFVCLFSKIARNYLENYYICFLFIAFHEFAHVFAAAVFGYSLREIHIRISGLTARLENSIIGLKAVLVYLAGPLSNILLAMLFPNIEIIFEINVALAFINLVPIKPLDGYNILFAILGRNISKKGKRNILNIVSIIAEIILWFLSILLVVKYCNISLIILLLYIKLINLNSAK